MPVENTPNTDSFTLKLVEYVRTSLSQKGLIFSTDSSETVQILMFNGSKLQITIRLFCGASYLTLHGALPVIISATAIPDLIIYLNSLSATIPIGNYEIHPLSRLVAFKVGLCVPPEPTIDQLSSIINIILQSLDSISSEVLNFGEK